ncbi:MAG: four helix bundle protein [Calditrichaeota bacterium]|nr:four helix bundle protein [Calditrichota bacterium]
MSYQACLRVMKEVLPRLPAAEKYDLRDQLSRSVKAIPRLIAEGYAKRHQKHGFQKYLDDAMAECNETIVGLQMCRDLYGEAMRGVALEELIDSYDKAGKQLYRLSLAWSQFKDGRRQGHGGGVSGSV